jgi:hypothetical protein
MCSGAPEVWRRGARLRQRLLANIYAHYIRALSRARARRFPRRTADIDDVVTRPHLAAAQQPEAGRVAADDDVAAAAAEDLLRRHVEGLLFSVQRRRAQGAR